MRVVVLGGTRFVGRAVVEELVAHGHELLVVHRGVSEPAGGPDVPHLHVERSALSEVSHRLRAFEPEGAVDCFAMSRADAEAALGALPPGLPLVVLSSVDVYRAFASLHRGVLSDAVPLAEDAPLRGERYPYRGKEVPEAAGVDLETYEKLDVEEAYAAAGATVLRLPFVYGEHDDKRREEIVLRRVRARRERIPFGPGTFLGARVYARDVAAAVRLALVADAARGETFNIAERRTWPAWVWAERVIAAAGSTARLVRVPEQALPSDLRDWSAGDMQPILVDASKARELLGWRETDPEEALARSVTWHLANPPQDADNDFTADDTALGSGLSLPH